ncbi:hypothetical protein [Desertibacillus haloalkaliphilus]|uniref:hypothetical protein n=1 Tax=Desertibacillus haloalkaliphilus TaxID=1328930 RepID=UPI001C263F20|nr:hypothetical protein [Desertibacillus haloalkaliphilus]MBU8906509.1 hypothetical protein [Desertibacillus haloalkaliphilus]
MNMDELKEMLTSVIQKELKDFRNEMIEKFEAVDKRFGEMDERFEGMDKRFGEMDKRFTGIEGRLINLEEGQKAMQADIEVLKAGQQSIRKEMTDRFAEVNTRLDTLTSDIEYTYLETSKNKLEIHRLKIQ